MKLSALIVFVSSCEAGWRQHREGNMSNPEAKAAWKRQLKAFRQCKRSKCQAQCPDKNWLQESCFTCLKTSQCPLPDRVNKAIECAQESCSKECVGDLFNEKCSQCRTENCPQKQRGQGKHHGQKERQNSRKNGPLAVLNKYTLTRPGKLTISDGSAAFRRCAMGMCVQECVLNPDDVKCEECITSYCQRASDNYTCIAAEQESGKLFFCSNVATCAGANAGGVRVQALGSYFSHFY
ncbi:Oidioi.mRNA.OKI2018_I69.XSR.g13986.t1.cds [Oikopleura dioica]|uniref:Oidioi.mRNA.OKI2018_I69.XSR.g13986.t1.cds n=1 Tax=Oikopleura dioica TaxID=34765 RepID=A0ABN7S8M5_OIKDI|nr:Oidioi.mRNA.OKI2018_I69.XSR.g13986.t1.cds [Oikopleura dioica]